jgi:hypothetical protein
MLKVLQHAHSGLRWVVLLLLIMAIAAAWRSWKSGAEWNKKVSLFALIFTHIQLVLGLVLYFTSPYVQFGAGVMKDAQLRFYTVEHIAMMLIAITLITIGYSRAKRKASPSESGKATFIFYLIGLILILVSIPWPFRAGLGGGWF